MTGPAPSGLRGGLFFREAEDVTANVLLKKLREGGRLSKADPRSLEGFELDEAGLAKVGLAIHKPDSGWWAVVDSADGAAGIGAGESSMQSIMANHLGTTMLWYRVYSRELALAVESVWGTAMFRAVAGSEKHVEEWLSTFACPTDAAPPKDAGPKVKLATIAYEEAEYRKGPNDELAAKLLALRHAVEGGDTKDVRATFESLDDKETPLGLALLRGLEGDDVHRTFTVMAKEILAAPMVPRGKRARVLTLGEEVLRRVAEATNGDAEFERCLDRLDAIESEAEGRSAHAYTSGVARVAALTYAEAKGRSFECYRRLIARGDAPDWNHVNLAIATLLDSREQITLEGDVAEVARRSIARLPALGRDARYMVEYNLACLYARAGELDEALDHFERCGDPTKLNPTPEADTDLKSICEHPRFKARLPGAAKEEEARESVDEEDEEQEAEWIVPAERAIPRLTLELRDGGDGQSLSSRIGGLPNGPRGESLWPSTESRPMDFVLQLTGTAGGGDLDMGDIRLLQVFADLEGEYYEQNELVVHREPCPAVLPAPLGVDLAPVRSMSFEAGNDDRVLIDVEWPFEGEPFFEEHRAAWSHACVDKAFGVPVGGNLQPEYITDSAGQPMRCLLQLMSHDDWFHWYIFASADFRELELVVIR